MSEAEDWREFHRVDIDGDAFWSAGRTEGSCRLRNLSIGGAGIAELRAPLRVGGELRFTLRLGDRMVESVPAQVIRVGEEELALRFLKLNDEQRTLVEQAIEERARGE